MISYKEKINKEKRWHTKSDFQENHFLNSKLFYSSRRNIYNYIFPKKQLFDLVSNTIRLSKFDNPAILIAPIYSNSDLWYYKTLSNNISGIDISEEVIAGIEDPGIKKYVGDIKNMAMFPDDYFDIIVSPLFFHHFCRFGFDNFLKEIHRVLKPQGYFFALEPSSLNPASFIAKLMQKIFGNITGKIEDEAAFIPFKFSKAMKRSGFYDIKIYGASFVHNRIPIFIAKICNILTYPFLRFPVVKNFSWMCLFYGRK